MKISPLGVLTVVLALSTAALAGAAFAGGDDEGSLARAESTIEPPRVAAARRQETTTQRSGRFAYVKTKFGIAPGSTTFAGSRCPRGFQLTGAFSGGSVSGVGEIATGISGVDSKDRGNAADNGAQGVATNPSTLASADARVVAICERTKKRAR